MKETDIKKIEELLDIDISSMTFDEVTDRLINSWKESTYVISTSLKSIEERINIAIGKAGETLGSNIAKEAQRHLDNPNLK